MNAPASARRLFLVLVGLALAAPGFVRAAAPDLPTERSSFLARYCLDCHDRETSKGGLDLSAPLAHDADPATHRRWVRAYDRVRSGEMPPPAKPQPTAEDASRFLRDLGAELTSWHAERKGTVLRRLNRHEYENTVNDLLGIRVDLASLLPDDGRAQGFDTVGDALRISDAQIQRYLEAADYALKVALHFSNRPETTTNRFSLVAERNQVHFGKSWLKRPDGAVVIFTSDAFPSTQIPDYAAPVHGQYRVRITGYGYQVLRPVPFALISGTFHRGGDQRNCGFFELPPGTPTTVEAEVTLRPGDNLRVRPLGISGPDGHSPTKDGPERYPGEGLAILQYEVTGPLIAEWPLPGRRILLRDAQVRELEPAQPWLKRRRDYQPVFAADIAQPRETGRQALEEFVPLAFRHPVSPGQIAPYLALFQKELAAGNDYLNAITTAATAVLCSPDFLYFREPAGDLDDLALANRLSYFLTRHAPDDPLRGLADRHQLTQPGLLRSQTERLLAGPGLDRWIADFTDAWLNLRDIEFTTPDKNLYPEFDELLLDSMLRETRGFIREILSSNLSLTNLIQSDFAMLNGRLARHYGLIGVEGLAIRRVSLPPGSRRGGLLTQASVLKVSANGTTTSPVVRGAWVLERLLGNPPQPPPPGVPGIEPDTRGARTLREQLAKHRQLESCNTCHRIIDPPGFALENYDVIGGWRDRFRTMGEGVPVRLRVDGRTVRYRVGPPVDSSGQLPSGESFRNFGEFLSLLSSSSDSVARCVIEKLLTFATGRELGFSDRPEIERLLAVSRERHHTFRDLLLDLVESPIFRRK